MIGLAVFLVAVALVLRRAVEALRVGVGSARTFPFLFLAFFLLYNITESSLSVTSLDRLDPVRRRCRCSSDAPGELALERSALSVGSRPDLGRGAGVKDGTPSRILIFDRGLDNPYSLGLASGLEHLGLSVRIAGPNRFPTQPGGRPVIVAVYPREGVPGQKIAKTGDAVAGIRRLVRLVRSFRPTCCTFSGPACPTTRWHARSSRRPMLASR